MSYLRFCLVITAGIGGYLYKTTSDKRDKICWNRTSVIPYLHALYKATSKEINGYFYRSIMNQFRINILNDEKSDNNSNAETLSAIDLIDRFQSDNDYLMENEDDDVQVNDDHCILTTGVPCQEPTFDNPLIYNDPDIATRQMILYPQFTIFFDREGKTNNWTIEHIDCENVEHFQHRHFEAMVLGYKDPKQSYSTINITEHLAYIRSTRLEPDPTIPKHFICQNCKCSNFWPVFHKYVTFLTGIYETVYVCSGYLYLDEKRKAPKVNVSNRCPSHFFKILVCKNPDWTFRFECYKVKIEQLNAAIVDLKDYLVTREELENDTKIHLIGYVEPGWVRETETHPEFNCFEVPPEASKVEHICPLCVPFQYPTC
uniref:Uncharacterized protein n=1 Tax=Strigamia maritima TaxID=126957 RepID=T1IR71_STRMM